MSQHEFQTKTTDHLSSSDRSSGQRRYMAFSMLNAIPVACLMENVLILYALRNRLSEPLVAVMASFIHLTTPFVILGKRLVARMGLARAWALCWALRYVFAALLIAAPFFGGSETGWAVSAILVMGTFGLMSFRSIGMVATTPLVGEITSERERGHFISHNAMLGSIIYLAATVAIIWLVRRWDHMVTYQLVIAFGCVVGWISAAVLKGIPESGHPRISARQPLGAMVRRMVTHPPYRRLLLAWCWGFVSFAMIVPFAIMALKSGYNVSDHSTLFYSTLLLVGAIAGSWANGVIADHVGPRPLMLLYSGGSLVVCIALALAPLALVPVLFAVLFLVAGWCKQGLLAGLGHYQLSLVEPEERVGAGLLCTMGAGAAAGLAGALVGGGMLRILANTGLTNLDVYRWYFRIMTVLLLPMLVAMWRLPRLKEWAVRDVLGLVLAPRDLRAMIALNRVRDKAGKTEDLSSVRRLGRIASDVSEDAVIGYLQSAHLSVRSHALRALARQDRLSSAACEALCAELRQGEFTTAWVAAEILGDKGIRSAVPALRLALDSGDFFMKGKAMHALVQLRDKPSYDRIVSEFEQTDNPRLVIYGAHAVGLIGNAEHVRILLSKAVDAPWPGPVCDEVFSSAAGMVGQGEAMYRLLKEWRNNAVHIAALLGELCSALDCVRLWNVISRAKNDEERLCAVLAIYRIEHHWIIGMSDDEVVRLAKQALAYGILEKLALCGCILKSAEPVPSGGDRFLRMT